MDWGTFWTAVGSIVAVIVLVGSVINYISPRLTGRRAKTTHVSWSLEARDTFPATFELRNSGASAALNVSVEGHPEHVANLIMTTAKSRAARIEPRSTIVLVPVNRYTLRVEQIVISWDEEVSDRRQNEVLSLPR